MGYIWAIYYLYLLTYLLLPFPVGYPSYYPAGTRVINYPDTAALVTLVWMGLELLVVWCECVLCVVRCASVDVLGVQVWMCLVCREVCGVDWG